MADYFERRRAILDALKDKDETALAEGLMADTRMECLHDALAWSLRFTPNAEGVDKLLDHPNINRLSDSFRKAVGHAVSDLMCDKDLDPNNKALGRMIGIIKQDKELLDVLLRNPLFNARTDWLGLEEFNIGIMKKIIAAGGDIETPLEQGRLYIEVKKRQLDRDAERLAAFRDKITKTEGKKCSRPKPAKR